MPRPLEGAVRGHCGFSGGNCTAALMTAIAVVVVAAGRAFVTAVEARMLSNSKAAARVCRPHKPITLKSEGGERVPLEEP